MDIIEILNNLSLESNIKLEEVPEIDLYMYQVIQLIIIMLKESYYYL